MTKKPTIIVVYYSMYGHVQKLAREIVKGLEQAGVNAKLYQVAETLSQEVLAKMHASSKASDVPLIKPQDLKEADGFLFGLPTRFGTLPSQVSAFFDSCGQLWMSNALHGKFAGCFFSTSSPGAGQESTAYMCLPFFTHMGINYVPYGSKNNAPSSAGVNGGSAWGSGAIIGEEVSRNMTKAELDSAFTQGLEFGKLMCRFKFGEIKSSLCSLV